MPNINITKIIIAGLFVIISGCTSVKTKTCPVGKDGAPVCESMKSSYDSAVSGGGTKQSVFPRRGDTENDSNQNNNTYAVINTQQQMGFPGVEDPGQPVFRPPEPHRVWVSPYRDSRNLLHGGEYVYYVVGGAWNYGTLTQPGSGSELLGPLSPKDLGFKPTYNIEDKDVFKDEGVQSSEGVIQPFRQVGGLPQ